MQVSDLPADNLLLLKKLHPGSQHAYPGRRCRRRTVGRVREFRMQYEGYFWRL